MSEKKEQVCSLERLTELAKQAKVDIRVNIDRGMLEIPDNSSSGWGYRNLGEVIHAIVVGIQGPMFIDSTPKEPTNADEKD